MCVPSVQRSRLSLEIRNLADLPDDHALRSWGLKLIKTVGPKRARVAVARKLAVLMGRMWKDGVHFDAAVAA